MSVLLGNADGTFQPAQNSATGAGPSLAVGDFNADGKLDLATANASDVSVLLGNGNGTFQAPPTSTSAPTPTSVAVGDFNADGKLDLGVASSIYYLRSPAIRTTAVIRGYYPSYANVLLGNGPELVRECRRHGRLLGDSATNRRSRRRGGLQRRRQARLRLHERRYGDYAAVLLGNRNGTLGYSRRSGHRARFSWR